jgi:hypothetical protein
LFMGDRPHLAGFGPLLNDINLLHCSRLGIDKFETSLLKKER